MEGLYDEIVSGSAAQPGIIPLDLAHQDASPYEALSEELQAAEVRLDGLIHNASILGERKALLLKPQCKLHEVMQININAIFLLTRALMPLLEAAPSASVVLTSSGVGRRGKAYWGAYAVSKFATEGYMQVLADELAATSNIRVNSLNRAVNTAMRRAAYPESPLTNPAPSDLTQAWIYLMSDASREIHGQALSAQA